MNFEYNQAATEYLQRLEFSCQNLLGDFSGSPQTLTCVPIMVHSVYAIGSAHICSLL